MTRMNRRSVGFNVIQEVCSGDKSHKDGGGRRDIGVQTRHLGA